MKKSNLLIAVLSVLAASSGLTSCGGNSSKTVYNNDEDALVFATQDLDEVFNPFYYSSATDGSIVGMTQISMFTTDKDAQIAYGNDQPVVVLDYEQNYDKVEDKTTYTFVLKNNVKFSNGSYLTMQDVLFNLYEYLDPVYSGSSTMYSTDIVGLAEYRTQQSSKAGQDAFENKFTIEANERVNRLVTVLTQIQEENKSGNDLTAEELRHALELKETQDASNKEAPYANLYVEDFDFIADTFKKELESDYTANCENYIDNDDLDNEIEAFLYAEGLITIDLNKEENDPERITYYLGKDTPIENNWTKEDVINIVYDYYFPDTFTSIVNYWQTATTIRTQFMAEAKEKYFDTNERLYTYIEGIKALEQDTVVNGKNYSYARYDSQGNLTAGTNGGNEILSITINGVDPKAIWNFSFSVAPMYYYSNAEQIAKFDYRENFGVDYGNTEFQTNVIKDKNKIGLPMGAGAYKATDKYTNSENVTAKTFAEDNVVYFERNDNFLMGAPKIRKIRYKVVSSNQMTSALYQGEVHYCEPSAKSETISELNGKKSEGFSYSQAKALGYGYIGLNAGKDMLANVNVRRAVACTMNTALTLDYYPGTAEILHRTMSKVSWAYPTNATAYYEYDPTGETAKSYLAQAGYTQNLQGKMVDSTGKQLKLTFTIAGADDDHPAARTFYKSQDILNNLGCDITVRTDNDALSKLNNGELEVWAAAWSTTIDPDMYQTYHKDSQATSTFNWGYREFKADVNGTKYSYEKGVVEELSEKIDEGRETLDQAQRTLIYAECLDLVMDLCVEIPTYQRNDLFAYNSSFIDKSTMTPDSEISPYNGPINQIWNLSLVTK